MKRKKKKRVLLQVDYLTKKIYDVQEYSGDGKGIDTKVNDFDFLKKAETRGMDVYYVNRKLVERERDPLEFRNWKKVLEKELEELKAEERKAFSAYTCNPVKPESKTKLIEVSRAKSEKRKELMKLVQDNEDKIKAFVNRKFERAKFKYYCSICMIIRDDNEYLEEWLNWHVAQGVEHFYIYDHGSSEPVSEFIKTLAKDMQERVTVIWFGGKHDFAQHDAYNNCLKKYAKESRWIGFIDSDEMVRVKNGKTLPEFLKNFEDKAGLFIGWIQYNANGQRAKKALPVRERFTKLSKYDNPSGMGKVFLQPFCMRQMLTHNGFPVEGYEVVDENYNHIDDGAAWSSGLTTKKICVDHYYTKSYEEWLAKMARGSCDPYFNRKYQEFFKYNPDMEDCREETYPVQIYEVGEQNTNQNKSKTQKNKNKEKGDK